MKLKKNIFRLLALGLVAAGATACSDNNEPEPPVTEPVAPDAIVVVNNGVQSTGVPGTITLYNTATAATAADAFREVNAMSVGDTPQDVVVYGSKMYVSVFDSNCIWVLDAATMKIKKNIVPTAPAAGPRNFAVSGGKVYVSLYSGHVAAIDTTTMAIESTFEVGPNPEKIAIAGNKMYVANSDGNNWMEGNVNSSLSIVDLATMKQTFHKIGANVTSVVTNGTDVFALCMGNYNDIPATIKKVAADGSATDFCPGTIMTIWNNALYVINDPAMTPGNPTYKVYDTAGTAHDMFSSATEKPVAPCGIAVNTFDGSLVILSRRMGEVYPLYTEPGVAYLYNADLSLKGTFEIGINPTAAVFTNCSPE